MLINRKWCYPTKETFKMKPVRELIERYIDAEKAWIDPFVRNSIFKDYCRASNDINPTFDATFNLEALEFLKKIPSNSIDGVLFDPPYSPRQMQEAYGLIRRKLLKTDTQSSFYSKRKEEVKRITKKGSHVISFGWNSGGIGKTRGFKIIEILLVPHGSASNDTIVTVETKLL